LSFAFQHSFNHSVRGKISYFAALIRNGGQLLRQITGNQPIIYTRPKQMVI